MNSEKIVELTGLATTYRYRTLETLPDDEVERYLRRTRSKFIPIAKSFDDDANAEWLVRSYLSLKYLLAATVLGTTAQFSEERNIRVTRPYLIYYMIFNAARAFIFSLPCVKWEEEKSVEMTHSKTANLSVDRLQFLSHGTKRRHGERLEAARVQRELFSYRFPATGIGIFGEDLIRIDDAIETARLFSDLSQANLACLQAAIEKHGKERYGFPDPGSIKKVANYGTNGQRLIDSDDIYRINYFLRKLPHPIELSALATGGLVEDFFGAWSDPDDRSESYDPDTDYDLLLDLL